MGELWTALRIISRRDSNHTRHAHMPPHMHASVMIPHAVFVAKERKLPEDIDFIFIGSGIGSLYCGGLLAKAGYRVLVLEQHYVAGGCTHSFEDKGFEFDTGLHYVGRMEKYKLLLDLVSAKGHEVDWCFHKHHNCCRPSPPPIINRLHALPQGYFPPLPHGTYPFILGIIIFTADPSGMPSTTSPKRPHPHLQGKDG